MSFELLGEDLEGRDARLFTRRKLGKPEPEAICAARGFEREALGTSAMAVGDHAARLPR